MVKTLKIVSIERIMKIDYLKRYTFCSPIGLQFYKGKAPTPVGIGTYLGIHPL